MWCSTRMEPVHNSPKSNILRVGFTLNIKEGMLAEYKMHHDNSRPEIVKALHAVGMRNLRYGRPIMGTIPSATDFSACCYK